MDPRKYFLHTSHILPKYSPYYYPTWALLKKKKLGLSQILPITSHILSNLGFHKNTYHNATKIKPQIKLSPQKGPNSFILWAKLKKPNKTLLKTRCYIATLKNPLLHSTSKARCYMAPLKSLLLHDTSKSSLLHGVIFTKSYKVQMLF